MKNSRKMDANKLDLNKLWQGQTVPAPDFNALKSKIEKYKRKNIKKGIIGNLTLIATMVFLIILWLCIDFTTLFAPAGLTLVVFAIAMAVLKNHNIQRSYQKLDVNNDNTRFLDSLLALQLAQQKTQKVFMNIYFALLACGLGIYFLEFTSRMDFQHLILAYGLTFGWIAFVWLYLKPKISKKQNKEIALLIEETKQKSDLS